MLSSIKVQGALHKRCMQYYSKLQIWFWDIIEDFNDNPYQVTFQGEIQLFFKFISRCKKIFRLCLYTTRLFYQSNGISKWIQIKDSGEFTT